MIPYHIHFSPAAKPRTSSILRVAIYCRVSTDLEMQEGSFETQMRYFRQRIEADPALVLAGVYGDKGRTGRSIAARPQFQRMLADCEADRIDMIVTKSISRFARNIADCIDVLRRLRALGISVYFEKENLNSSSPQGEMAISILAAIAQQESSSIQQNVVWAICEHNASGRPHFRPSYGYTKARRDWQWHVNEQEARRVRRAFDCAASGMCYVDIGRILNDMEAREHTGRVWTRKRIRAMLSNVNYTGDCLTDRSLIEKRRRATDPNGQIRPSYYIEGHHEPLVSRELFDLVQDKVHSGALRSWPVRRAVVG